MQFNQLIGNSVYYDSTIETAKRKVYLAFLKGFTNFPNIATILMG